MEMFFTDEDGTLIEYILVTDHPEQIYWETFKFKKSNIKLLANLDKTKAAQIRELIVNQINSEMERVNVEEKPTLRR